MIFKPLVRICGLAIILICSLLISCGPSPEEQAATSVALTVAAATDTPTPTPTPTNTPTPTPVPYNLTVMAKGEEDAPIVGASIVLAEAGEDTSSQITDETGQAFWFDLPGETVSLSISAQGYIHKDASETIYRGPNDLTVALGRDPFGLLPSEACAPGESLLYIEDFQDNEAAGWQEINYGAMGWELMPHPETPDDIVARNNGDQSSGSHLEESDLDNAVWRFWIMLQGKAQIFLSWALSGPSPDQGGEYQVYFNAYNSIHVFNRHEASSDMTISKKYLPIEENVWHKYEVSHYEGRSEVWIDDALLLAYQDPHPIPSGKVGLIIFQTNDENFNLYFDDISICKLDAPFAPIPTPET